MRARPFRDVSQPPLRLVPPTSGVSIPQVDDAALLAAVRAGDPRAAEAFCRRILPPVERTVRRLIGRLDHDAEDLVQNAVIELVTIVDNYRGECSLDSWVSTVSAHLVYKHIRRRRLERRLFSELLLDSGEPGRMDPVAGGLSPAHAALASQLVALLDRMDSKRAWAFVLHDVCGFDLRETAEITGVSVSAAQSRLVRGRKELQDKVTDHADLATRLEALDPRRENER